MNDVICKIVLATGDKNFAAGNLLAIIGRRLGTSPNKALVCAGMELGQAHGAAHTPA